MQPSQRRLGWGAVYAFALAASLLAPARGHAAAPETDHLRLKHIALRLAEHAPLRIIAFGSSSTEGIGASSPAASYPSRLEAELRADLPSGEPVTVLNRGVGGEDADDMARRLPQVIAEHPDLIIWQTGSNDPLRAVPLDRFVQETVAGVQQIRAAHIDVMLMGPQLCRALDDKPSTVRYRDALRAIGEGMDVPVIRRHDLMRRWLADRLVTPAQMFAPDGLHMADGGYAALAHAVAADILHRVESPRLAMGTPQHN
ncbi:MAG: SGNH/GDSL hydrolase family protein [Nevskiales bacterium]